MRKPLIVVALGALAVAAVGVSIAGAGTKNGVTFETKYSSKKPDSSTGFKTNISGAPRDAQGRLEAATQVVVTFERGTAFNTSVPANCKRSALAARGPAGCSKKSIVGKGQAQAISGLSSIDPVKEAITAYNTKNGILFYLTGLQTAILPGTLKGSTLKVTVPPFPVPGNPKGAVLTSFVLNVPALSRTTTAKATRTKKSYVTTPAKCKKGKWTVKATFRYSTVPAITNVASVSKCRRK